MTAMRIAVIGGDAREIHLARRLADDGHDCVLFGHDDLDEAPATIAEAVSGRQWLICPSPGLGDRNRVYAPASREPIVLDEELLASTEASAGGIVLGRATPELESIAGRLAIPIFEMKDDRALATKLSTGVAEGLIALLIGQTTRILRDHRIVLLGYGVTGAIILDYLVGAGCIVTLVARSDFARERARQCGGVPASYEDRVAAMMEAEIIANTIPDVDAIPTASFRLLRDKLIVDIASPPGGMDHVAAATAGLRVHWARGLSGSRAPETAVDAQLAFVRKVIAFQSAPQAFSVEHRRLRP